MYAQLAMTGPWERFLCETRALPETGACSCTATFIVSCRDPFPQTHYRPPSHRCKALAPRRKGFSSLPSAFLCNGGRIHFCGRGAQGQSGVRVLKGPV
jgi:hypothetical protein